MDEVFELGPREGCVRMTQTGLLTAILLLGTAAVAAADTGKVYVPDYGGGTVSVLDAETLASLATIAIEPVAGPDCSDGSFPNKVALTPDHALAFVSLDLCNQIAVIDTATDSVVNYIAGSRKWSGEARIYMQPGGDRLYVTACYHRFVSVFDVATQSESAVIEGLNGGTYPLAFSPDGTIGYAGNGFSGSIADAGCDDGPMGVYRLDLGDNEVLGFIPTSQDVSGIAVSPGGDLALTTGWDRILVLDLATSPNAEIGAVTCAATATSCVADPLDGAAIYGGTAGLIFDPSGNRAYVLGYELDSFANILITVDTTDPLNPQELSRTEIAGNGSVWGAPVVSGGRLYVILSDDPSQVVIFDVSTDPPSQLTDPDTGEPISGNAGSFGFELDGWYAPLPLSVHQCKKGGWQAYGTFRNQGDCMAFVATKEKNPPGVGRR